MGVPATEGNLVEVLRNGHEIFPAMLDSIAGAQQSIDPVKGHEMGDDAHGHG